VQTSFDAASGSVLLGLGGGLSHLTLQISFYGI
jgi:hypothetical protein